MSPLIETIALVIAGLLLMWGGYAVGRRNGWNACLDEYKEYFEYIYENKIILKGRDDDDSNEAD